MGQTLLHLLKSFCGLLLLMGPLGRILFLGGLAFMLWLTIIFFQTDWRKADPWKKS